MAKKIVKKAAAPAPPEYPKEWVTFNPISYFNINMQNEPSAFNGFVLVRKYKITCEEIEEPIEVIHERIQSLWDNNTNYHHYHAIKAVAAKYAYTVVGDMGNRKRP